MARDVPWKRIDVARGEERSVRLDVILVSAVEGLSRRKAQELIRRGEVTVDGRPGRKGEVVGGGSRVEILAAPQLGRWGPRLDAETPLELLYEDDHLLAVNKASGVPSVPLEPDEPGTLAGALAARYPECRHLGRRDGDGGLIQRLDRETSGVMLAARDARVHDALVAAQARGGIGKTYLAVAARAGGRLPERIEIPLAPAGLRGSRMKADPGGAMATTEVVSQRERGGWLIAKVRIHRGQRHQIRAHLAAAGFPIAGDRLYGGVDAPRGVDRLCLHASEVELVHPVDGTALSICAPVPDQLAKIIE